MSKYIIYYSNFCPNCKDLLKELDNDSLINNFQKICIDEIKTELPSFLKEVPTIIVPDYNEPLVGINAFKWIKWKLQQDDNNIVKKDLNPYNNSSFSNAYSSLEDNNNLHFDNNSNFTNLSDDNKIITQTQDELQSFSNSLCKNNIEKSYEELIQSRNMQNSNITNISPYSCNNNNNTPELPPELLSMKTRN